MNPIFSALIIITVFLVGKIIAHRYLHPEKRIFIVHGRMFWITKRQLAHEVEPEDVNEVWEDMPKTEEEARKWFLQEDEDTSPAEEWDDQPR